VREEKIDVRTKLVGGFKDFLFRIYLRAWPGIALGGFKWAVGGVHLGEKLAQFRDSDDFLKTGHKLRVALQVAVMWAATVGSPRHLERFVIGTEFDCEVGLQRYLAGAG
jgi:hypothetical protein